MPFVKLDCGILNSTLWFEREAREVFITALLMAEPIELTEPMPQIAIGSLDYTGWSIPPGWYGFVAAASVGIIHQAQVPSDAGMSALARLGDPEQSSRSKEFDGRRLVRVDGGFIVLNFMKYRDRDYTAALRSARYRQRKLDKAAKDKESHRDVTASHRNITQAEAEAEAEIRDQKKKIPVPNNKQSNNTSAVTTSTQQSVALRAPDASLFEHFWIVYPKKVGKGAAQKAWAKIKPTRDLTDVMIAAVRMQIGWPQWRKDHGQFIPHPATWLNQGRWQDEGSKQTADAPQLLSEQGKQNLTNSQTAIAMIRGRR